MKTLLLVLGLVAAIPAAAMDIDKDMPQPIGPDSFYTPYVVSGSSSDLAPDGSFVDASGWRIADFNAGSMTVRMDRALRVFPSNDGGYWLAGYHTGQAHGYDIAIAKIKADGSLDTNYNGSGTRTIATTMLTIVDVAKGASDTLYFVGTQHTGTHTDTDLQIACVDNSGALCSGFGTNGIKEQWLDLGSDESRDGDYPHRIIWLSSKLYVVGEANSGNASSDNWAAFAINLSATSGELNLAFGNDPNHAGVFVYNPDNTPNGRDVAFDVYGYSPTPFAYRLILAGQIAGTAGSADTDGFVLSVNGVTGQVDGFISDVIYSDLGTSKQDAALRIARRHNGGFVVAGASRDDSTNPEQIDLLLGAWLPNGNPDYGFSNGNNMKHMLVVSGYNYPFAIAERADTRDLVIGLNIKDDLFGDGHALEAVVQFDTNANTQHALAFKDSTAETGQPKRTEGVDLLVSGKQVVTAGSRQWILGNPVATSDWDMTIARYAANDTIFADRFGGPTSD
ncbi:MAG: hypothetical protein ABIS07_09390 [Dokdonella sp.]